MPDRPLDADTIRQLLATLAGELPRDRDFVMIIAGGALLAVRGLRGSTVDVDAITRLDHTVLRAAARVARQEGLDEHWLSSSASAWRPAGVDEAHCELILERANLRVLGAPLPAVFLMKLNAFRAKDRADLRRLWALRPFESIDAAIAAFGLAYPGDNDEFLEQALRDLVGE